MAKDFIGYQALTDAALRGVVRDALRRIEKQGLIGSHHFYLTFKTKFPGVDIPDFLREQYPDEMTIILQHQFWGLKITEERFEVTLTFKKLRRRSSFRSPRSPRSSIPACSSACNSAAPTATARRPAAARPCCRSRPPNRTARRPASRPGSPPSRRKNPPRPARW
ncbi:MAG: ClpXP protease specificity-enhancing factor SspB [Rhizomicrobium sp.]